MKKRLFVAIEVPENTLQEIISFQKVLKEKIKNVSWVKPENIHLTLVFLGEVDYTEIPQIINFLYAVKSPRFKINARGIGGFPSLEQPHTIWIGVEKSRKIVQLQRRLVNHLQESGFEFEKREFKPHLTIARLGKKTNLKTRINLKKVADLQFGAIMVKELILFESELSSEGPVHKILRKVSLA